MNSQPSGLRDNSLSHERDMRKLLKAYLSATLVTDIIRRLGTGEAFLYYSFGAFATVRAYLFIDLNIKKQTSQPREYITLY